MNLETRLEPKLWEAVRANAEPRKFGNAVLDAIHFLSEVIRERSGLEGDGAALVGQAFGGNSPTLKVNKLQTESDQNVQRGMEALFRGVFQAIRNPRSHGPFEETERDATAIILFLDYLLRVVDQSKSPFSLALCVEKILDSAFVPSKRYATLLTEEIPVSKRLAVCREVFQHRSESHSTKLKHFFARVLEVMSEADQADLATSVSEELRQTSDDGTIIFVVDAFPTAFWSSLSEVARLRVAHKLVQSVIAGRFDVRKDRVLQGVLGTWSIRVLHVLLQKQDFWRAVSQKLIAQDRLSQDYSFRFLAPQLSDHYESPPSSLRTAVLNGLEAGDERFKHLVESWAMTPFDEPNPEHAWYKPFAAAMEQFIAVPYEAVSELTDDDIPF